MPHIKACLHGLCAHNLRLSRETKSNVDVGRKSNEKKKFATSWSTSSANYNWQAAQARPPAQFQAFKQQALAFCYGICFFVITSWVNEASY